MIYHIMTTKCPVDMKQMALQREFHNLWLYAKKLKKKKKKKRRWF